jgi:hypothetical protein
MVDLIPILRTKINSNQPTNQKEIKSLADSHITYVDRKAFLATF